MHFHRLFFACAIVALCCCFFPSCEERNTPTPTLLTLPVGQYMTSNATSGIVVFPSEQHGGASLSLYTFSDSLNTATRPMRITAFNDTTGTGVLPEQDDRQLSFRTNGKDSLTLIEVFADGGVKNTVYCLQPEVSYAPKSLSGEWEMKYEIMPGLSMKILKATIDESLNATVTLNIPDSATIAMMFTMSGMSVEDVSELFSGGGWTDMLAAIPSEFTAQLWYCVENGIGVIALDESYWETGGVPDGEGYADALPFTTPSASVIRFRFYGYELDLVRK